MLNSIQRYGTVLGTVIATMFPDNIEHMVLDGIEDPDAYFSGDVTPSLQDTDKAVQTFFDACYQSGPERCAFYDSSPEKISENLHAIFDQLIVQPMPAFNGTDYGLFDYNLLHSFIRQAAYGPYSTFPELAEGFAQIAKGNASYFFSISHQPNTFNCDCNKTSPNNTIDAQTAVL